MAAVCAATHLAIQIHTHDTAASQVKHTHTHILKWICRISFNQQSTQKSPNCSASRIVVDVYWFKSLEFIQENEYSNRMQYVYQINPRYLSLQLCKISSFCVESIACCYTACDFKLSVIRVVGNGVFQSYANLITVCTWNTIEFICLRF